MIRTLLTVLKMAVVLAAVVWVAGHPGSIAIDWLGYTLTFHVGLFLIALMVLLALGIFLFSFIKTVLDLPGMFSRYSARTAKDRGLTAVAKGISAIAAGDGKDAERQALRAEKALGEGHSLSLFLKAQAARLNGDEAEASLAYLALMKDKHAGFMGLKGLLQGALERGDYGAALEFGRKALQDYPRQGGILALVYDLELRAQNWRAARKVLGRMEKCGALVPEKAARDRVALLLAQALAYKDSGDEKSYLRMVQKAYKVMPAFLPAALWLAEAYIAQGKQARAAKVIERIWRVSSHPELTALWAKAYRVPTHDTTAARVLWFERLLKIDPVSVEGLLAMASLLTQEGLWGDARVHLEKAEAVRPNVHLYKLWARLEEAATGNKEAGRLWLEKAENSVREKVWICSETGRLYDAWAPVSDQGLFNTIIWDFPSARHVDLSHVRYGLYGRGLIGVGGFS